MDVEEKDTAMTSATSPDPKQHEELWFTDGNIVLKTDCFLFRVHKGVLSLNSLVFKEMFFLPCAQESNSASDSSMTGMAPEFYEGVQLCALSDDGKDVEHLLKAIYIIRYYNPYHDDHSGNKIAALLRISAKYDAKPVYETVLENLCHRYPSALGEFQKRHGVTAQGPDYYPMEHIKVLKVAINLGIDGLFPALYHACFCMATTISAGSFPTSPEGEAAFVRCLESRSRFQNKFLRLVDLAVRHSDKCVCLHMRTHRLEQVGYAKSALFGFLDKNAYAIEDMTGVEISAAYKNRLCDECKKVLIDAIEAERLKIWYMRCPVASGWNPGT